MPLSPKMSSAIDALKPKVLKNGRTRSEVGKANKIRGKQGEGYFAKKLSEISGFSFTRVPNSGAAVGLSNRNKLATMGQLQHLILLGDIISPLELKYNCIWECKNYSSFSFTQLEKGKAPAVLQKWISEILYDIESARIYRKDKETMGFLCFKIKNQGNWICYCEEVNLNMKYNKNPQYTIIQNNFQWYIEDFSKFITNNKQIFDTISI